MMKQLGELIKRDFKGRFLKGYAPLSNQKGIHLSPLTEFKQGHKPLAPFKKGNKLWANEKTRSNFFQKGEKNIMAKLEISQKVSIASKGKHYSRNTEFKKGENFRAKNINWNNGSSFEPYGLEFNKQLKEDIRKKYMYRCQQCFRHQNELGKKLSVHHIDFNKKNNNKNNLIPLCDSCHMQTQFNRKNWTDYFQSRINKESFK